MTCAMQLGSNLDSVLWHFVPLGNLEIGTAVSRNELITQAETGNYTIEDMYNLVVTSPSVGRAGRYLCRSGQFGAVRAGAEVIMLGESPVCSLSGPASGDAYV